MTEASDQTSIEEEPKTASQCPVCRYSLVDLAVDQPCPECGVEIDRDLLVNPQMRVVIRRTKLLCVLGGIGWLFSIVLYLTILYSSLTFDAVYGDAPPGSLEYRFAWLSSSFVLLPLIPLIMWFNKAQRIVYLDALKHHRKQIKMPIKVMALSFPGISLGFIGFILVLLLVSAAMYG